ncbi:MAG: hypothetical protein MUE97_01550 [Phycisphaerales bacterium]|nr:hypothetical protein [Phycisphaerales bacterium]
MAGPARPRRRPTARLWRRHPPSIVATLLVGLASSLGLGGCVTEVIPRPSGPGAVLTQTPSVPGADGVGEGSVARPSPAPAAPTDGSVRVTIAPLPAVGEIMAAFAVAPDGGAMMRWADAAGQGEGGGQIVDIGMAVGGAVGPGSPQRRQAMTGGRPAPIATDLGVVVIEEAKGGAVRTLLPWRAGDEARRLPDALQIEAPGVLLRDGRLIELGAVATAQQGTDAPPDAAAWEPVLRISRVGDDASADMRVVALRELVPDRTLAPLTIVLTPDQRYLGLVGLVGLAAQGAEQRGQATPRAMVVVICEIAHQIQPETAPLRVLHTVTLASELRVDPRAVAMNIDASADRAPADIQGPLRSTLTITSAAQRTIDLIDAPSATRVSLARGTREAALHSRGVMLSTSTDSRWLPVLDNAPWPALGPSAKVLDTPSRPRTIASQVGETASFIAIVPPPPTRSATVPGPPGRVGEGPTDAPASPQAIRVGIIDGRPGLRRAMER